MPLRADGPRPVLSELSAHTRLIAAPRADSVLNQPGGSIMLSTIRKPAATVVALGALALGGAAVAGAADNTTKSSGSSSAQSRQAREALSSEVAAKVKAAA